MWIESDDTYPGQLHIPEPIQTMLAFSPFLLSTTSFLILLPPFVVCTRHGQHPMTYILYHLRLSFLSPAPESNTTLS